MANGQPFPLVKGQLSKVNCHQRGFVASLITIVVLIFMLTVAMSLTALIFNRQRISTNTILAAQSYYADEAGIEDSLIRLKNNPQMSALSYTLIVNNATANVTISAIIGGARPISSQGNNNNLIKTTQIVYAIDSQKVSFHYAAQVGAGGLATSNGSRVKGGVFSNGNITGSGTIDNDVVVAGNGHSIKDVYVGGNVLAYSCLSSASVANLTYVTGGSHTCTVRGATSSQSSEILPQPLPISQSQIDGWKADATAGGASGSVTVSGTQSLGPKKITGNLTINNSATLKITGTIYVTGQISLSNNATIKLDSSYGSLGGVILSDGKIDMGENSIASGSGQSGSYLLMLTTNSANDALTLNNNVVGSVFYASAGTINLNNNVQTKEVTGYGIALQNNAVITYESGLINSFFSSGPGGTWKVTSWQEK